MTPGMGELASPDCLEGPHRDFLQNLWYPQGTPLKGRHHSGREFAENGLKAKPPEFQAAMRTAACEPPEGLTVRPLDVGVEAPGDNGEVRKINELNGESCGTQEHEVSDKSHCELAVMVDHAAGKKNKKPQTLGPSRK